MILAEPPIHVTNGELWLYAGFLLLFALLYVLVPLLLIFALVLVVRSLLTSREKPRRALWTGGIGLLLTGVAGLAFGAQHVGRGNVWMDVAVFALPLLFTATALLGGLRLRALRRKQPLRPAPVSP